MKKNRFIPALAMSVDAGQRPQALRSTVIELSFDGERTAWAPVIVIWQPTAKWWGEGDEKVFVDHFGHINADCFYFDISPRK